MAARIATTVQLILAISIFYLGYSIHSMANKVNEVIDTYPHMIADINSLQERFQIEDWLVAVDAFKELMPKIVVSVDNATRAASEINQTATSIDAKIPLVIGEFARYRTTTIPSVISEAKQYRQSVIPPLLIESQGYRSDTVPKLISESQALRKEIPPILVQADVLAQKTDDIMNKSQELAQQATQGAVKGVILSPIDLIREAGIELKDRASSVIVE